MYICVHMNIYVYISTPLILLRINDPAMDAVAHYGVAKLASIVWSNEIARRYPVRNHLNHLLTQPSTYNINP